MFTFYIRPITIIVIMRIIKLWERCTVSTEMETKCKYLYVHKNSYSGGWTYRKRVPPLSFDEGVKWKG